MSIPITSFSIISGYYPNAIWEIGIQGQCKISEIIIEIEFYIEWYYVYIYMLYKIHLCRTDSFKSYFTCMNSCDPHQNSEWVTAVLLPRWCYGKAPACQCRRHRDAGFIPGLGRFPGGGHGNPLQYSCLENPMDRGAWWAIAHGVTESDMTGWLSIAHHHAAGKGTELQRDGVRWVLPQD